MKLHMKPICSIQKDPNPYNSKHFFSNRIEATSANDLWDTTNPDSNSDSPPFWVALEKALKKHVESIEFTKVKTTSKDRLKALINQINNQFTKDIFDDLPASEVWDLFVFFVQSFKNPIMSKDNATKLLNAGMFLSHTAILL